MAPRGYRARMSHNLAPWRLLVVVAALGNLIGLATGTPIVVLISAPLMIVAGVKLAIVQRRAR